MAEYSKIAKGHVTTVTGGGTAPINLPFQPSMVKWWNRTAYATPTDTWVYSGYWDSSMGQGNAVVDLFATGPVTTTSSLTSGGISTYAGGLSLQYGANVQVVGITKASPAVVTATGHGLVTGDVVIFQGLEQSSTTGMQQIAGMPFTVTVSDANTFTIPWNTNQSGYTALSGSPSGAYVKKVLYPNLYFPGAKVISAITTGTTTTIDTTSAHNFVVGQEVAFRIPAAWGTTELNSLPNVVTPGSPIYGYVVAVTDYNTVVVNIDSSSYTAFNSNQAFASFSGEQFPQILAVGDVNTGGVQISSGSALYPPPYAVPIGTTQVDTINGPAIQGAYVNNTSQGFIIGASAAPIASQLIYWEATYPDYAVN